MKTPRTIEIITPVQDEPLIVNLDLDAIINVKNSQIDNLTLTINALTKRRERLRDEVDGLMKERG